jgi:hypothetical protein
MGSLFKAVSAFEHGQDTGGAVGSFFGLTHEFFVLKINVEEGCSKVI